MVRKQISLEELNETQRNDVSRTVFDRLDAILLKSFSPANGYSHEKREFFPQNNPQDVSAVVWRVSKGKFWGLKVSAFRATEPFRLKIGFSGFTPSLQVLERLKLGLDEWRSPVERALVSHILIALLIFPTLVLLPFFVVYHLSLLRFLPEERRAAREFEEDWSRFQNNWPAAPQLTARKSPIVLYGLLVAIAIPITCILWWCSDLYPDWQVVLGVGLFGFGVVSLILFIAFILAFFGFMD